jgi:hypothetical protein
VFSFSTIRVSLSNAICSNVLSSSFFLSCFNRTCFTNIFFGALESVICRVLCEYGLHDVSSSLDFYMLILIPISFIVLNVSFVGNAICARNSDRNKAEASSVANNSGGGTNQLPGVSRSLLKHNVIDVENLKKHHGFKDIDTNVMNKTVGILDEDLEALEEDMNEVAMHDKNVRERGGSFEEEVAGRGENNALHVPQQTKIVPVTTEFKVTQQMLRAAPAPPPSGISILDQVEEVQVDSLK